LAWSPMLCTDWASCVLSMHVVKDGKGQVATAVYGYGLFTRQSVSVCQHLSHAATHWPSTSTQTTPLQFHSGSTRPCPDVCLKFVAARLSSCDQCIVADFLRSPARASLATLGRTSPLDTATRPAVRSSGTYSTMSRPSSAQLQRLSTSTWKRFVHAKSASKAS
jgi:hypothetical protein